MSRPPSSSRSSSFASSSARVPVNGGAASSSTASSILPSSSPLASSPDTLSRRRNGKPTPHPLSSIGSPDNVEDATRPKLARRTTEAREELERVGRSSESSDGGLRQSLELLRKGKVNIEGDVDVLVHEVQPTDTIAKVALLYGVELSILRKANKLWTADSIHLRKTLYVPLDACRLRETVVHGPGPDQVTLIANPRSTTASAHQASSPIAHVRSRTTTDESETGDGWSSPSFSGSRRASGSEAGWDGDEGADGLVAKRFLGGTSMIYSSEGDDRRPSTSTLSSPSLGGASIPGYPISPHSAPPNPPLITDLSISPSPSFSSTTPAPPPPTTVVQPPTERVLTLLRIPASDLSFFPKSATSSARSSIDSRPPPLPSTPSHMPSSYNNQAFRAGSKTISRFTSLSKPNPANFLSPNTQRTLSAKRSSPSLSSRLTSLFVDPNPPPPMPLLSSPSSMSTLRPAAGRTRSVSSSDLFSPKAAAPAVDMELTPTASSSLTPTRTGSPTSTTTNGGGGGGGRRADWFGSPAGEPIRKQLEPAKPMMVGKGGGDVKGRRVGDGLGNGSAGGKGGGVLI